MVVLELKKLIAEKAADSMHKSGDHLEAEKLVFDSIKSATFSW